MSDFKFDVGDKVFNNLTNKRGIISSRFLLKETDAKLYVLNETISLNPERFLTLINDLFE